MRLRPGIWQVLWFTHPLKITFLSAHIMATVKIRIIYLFSHHGQPEIIVSDRDPRFLDTLSGLNYSAIRHTVVYVYGRDGCRVFEDVFHSYASLISHIIKFGSFIDRICNTMLYIREPVWRPFFCEHREASSRCGASYSLNFRIPFSKFDGGVCSDGIAPTR